MSPPETSDDSTSYTHPSESSPVVVSDESLWWETLTTKEQDEYASRINGPLISRPDLLIVGCGLAGLATGCLAAEKGLSVQLLDARGLQKGIPDLDAGMIWPIRAALSGEESDRDFLLYCRDAWSRLTVRPGIDLNWKVCGLLATPTSPLTHALLPEAEHRQAEGWPIQEVEPSQVETMEPALTFPSSTGLFCPGEGVLHPLRAALSFLRRIAAKNGGCRTGVQIDSVEIVSNRLQSVTTSAGKFEPKQILFATEQIPQELAGTMPVPSLDGQELLMGMTRSFMPMLRHAVSDTVEVQQLKTGEMIVGALQPRRTPEEDSLRDLDTKLRDLFADEPLMKCVKLMRQEVRRPKTFQPDVRQLSTVQNAWWLPGLRDETLQCVGTGQLILDWITTGKQPERLTTSSA
ncbi:MAG: FAD-dependent oxidoreductase [Planctomycetales bacterium]